MTTASTHAGQGVALGSVVALLARQAAERGDRRAFTFSPEQGEARPGLTFAELDRRSRALAARLLEQAQPGDRAVLFFLPGLDFLVAFFGCIAAGIVAVPLMLPRRAGTRDAALSILEDCAPKLALTGRDAMAARPDVVERYRTAFNWVVVDAAEDATAPEAALPSVARDDLAFLQYTSGSTSSPKGVMVSHANLLANLSMIQQAMGNTEHSTSVGWVPLYHDMGLIMQVMQPLYLGTHSVLMAPAAFMQRPLSWLRAISAFRAEVTSAPDFAFDLCVSRFRPEQMEGIDLSCLEVALNGAEPVRAGTMERFAETFAPYGFAAEVMYPGYGLAEATLLVSGGRRGFLPEVRGISRAALQAGRAAPPVGDQDAQSVVACGRSMLGQRIAVVDPQRLKVVPPGMVGEIWVSGPNVAQGYWRKPEATGATFRAQIAGEADAAGWLRTGDLGFLDETGALFITGRAKDLVIIRGMNHYPQDIEHTVQSAHPALRRDGGAAFSHPDETGVETLVVVQEVERTKRHDLQFEEVVNRIRAAVAAEHEIAVHEVALIRPATLPKTTSGKVQRSLTRKLWLEDALDRA